MMAMVADVQPLIPADAANSLLPSPTVYCPAAVRNEGRGIASREARKPASRGILALRPVRQLSDRECSVQRLRSVSIHGIEDSLTMMFKYSLNFKQVVERSFGQPNILAVGSKSFNNRFL